MGPALRDRGTESQLIIFVSVLEHMIFCSKALQVSSWSIYNNFHLHFSFLNLVFNILIEVQGV